ncbi:Peroxidase 5 [Hibiscus syriacus]|uniref:Peroxidase n=1 Tax=Hibiscus syriacus TaxID=106335 RepID=A0A6A2WLP2_HIBSY|nr:Peroxidase 5 [Hibiscus syriacus]
MAATMISLSSNFHIVGFYTQLCPSAEIAVRRAVNEAVSSNPSVAAGLIRMYFHDCFVMGCDASIILKSLPGNPPVEMEHPANNTSLRGFKVIDESKARIEALCPGTVSCADILAFAARDGSYEVGRIYYDVPAGGRDGHVSLGEEVSQNLPQSSFGAQQLAQTFARKGMSVDEMATLSGAHSIGVSHCSSFVNRLYSFNATHTQDPSLDPNCASFLKTRCPSPPSGAGGDLTTTVPLDMVTPNRLDNKYYSELKHHRGLLTSDQTLIDRSLTSRMVSKNGRNGAGWARKFARAVVHMGSIDVLTGAQGEIRRICSVPN